MLHSKHILLLKGKTEAELTKTQFRVNRGVVYRVYLTFPPGCAGLVKVRILHESHPFLPVEQDAYIRGNAHTFEYPIFYEITTGGSIITIEAWNEDDTYNHTIDVQMLIVDKKYVMPVGAGEGIIAALASLFRRRS